jgi:hypothetical protein
MADRRSLRRTSPHGFTAVALPHARLAGLALLAAAPLLVIAAVVPRAVFLPSVSLAAIVAATAAAFAAWWFGARRHRDTVTLWDIAGACALIGCAAAMLSEPEAILNTIGQPSNP